MAMTGTWVLACIMRFSGYEKLVRQKKYECEGRIEPGITGKMETWYQARRENILG